MKNRADVIDAVNEAQYIRTRVLHYFTKTYRTPARSPFMTSVTYHLDQVCIQMLRTALDWEDPDTHAYSDEALPVSTPPPPIKLEPTDERQITLFDEEDYLHV